MLNGIDHIRIQTGMSIAIDVAGRLLQILVRFVCFLFVCKLPDINVIGRSTAKLYSTLLAKHIKSLFQILRIDIGCSLDGTDGTVFEFHNRHTDVFRFQIMMELLSGHAVDFLHLIAEHPS